MKKVLTTLSVLALLAPLAAFAAYNDVQLTSGSSITMTVGSSLLTFTVSNGLVQTLQVNAGSVSAHLESGSQLDITSTDRTTFTYALAGAAAGFTCTDSYSSLLVTAPSAQDVTVTPTGSACTTNTGSGSNNGGAGGAGTPNPSPSPSPAPSPSPSPNPAPSPVVAPVANLISTITPPAPAVAPAPASIVSPVFNKDLTVGSKGDDVKRLQQLLATDKEIYPDGSATGYLGNLTKAAIVKFQIKYGVIKKSSDPGSGNLGPKTRAKIKEVFGNGVTPVTPTPTPTPSPSPVSSDSAAKIQQLQSMLQQLQALQAALKAH
jgi:hypothetical protein